MKLGSLRAAEKILDEIGSGDNAQIGQAHYHFLKNIILFHRGDMVAVEAEIQKAEDAKSRDTEPLVQVEIALNHGVSYVTMQNYQAADDCFRRAAAEYKRLKLKEPSLQYLIYYNYAYNKTRIDSTESGLAIVDEYKSLLNLKHPSDQVRPTDKETFQEQLTSVEAFLPSMVKHPSLAEFTLRLSFYYLLLDKYDKCTQYYDKFDEACLSLNHFSPWMHRYRMLTAFSVRIIHFKQIIEQIKDSIDLQRSSQATQKWFGSFPNHDGILDSMLLARFIGYDAEVYPLKLKLWLDPERMEEPRAHGWLYINELGLNADITYSQFTEEENTDLIFTDVERHPFESNESKTVFQDSCATGMFFKGVLFKQFRKSELLPDQARLFDEISRLIDANVPKECLL